MDQETEKQLILDAQQNMQAFASLYDHYFPRIFAYCLNRSGSKEIAEDATSQAFLKSIPFIKNFDFNKYTTIGPLLFAIAHNALQDHYRKEQQNVPLEDYRQSDPEDGAIATTEKELEISELQMQIITVLNSINERYAEIITLKFYSELSTIEIADTMDIKPSHVPVLLFRALESFRDEFKEKFPETEIFYSI